MVMQPSPALIWVSWPQDFLPTWGFWLVVKYLFHSMTFKSIFNFFIIFFFTDIPSLNIKMKLPLKYETILFCMRGIQHGIKLNFPHCVCELIDSPCFISKIRAGFQNKRKKWNVKSYAFNVLIKVKNTIKGEAWMSLVLFYILTLLMFQLHNMSRDVRD